MPFAAVVRDVTELVRRDGGSAALAFWNDVVMVEISDTNAPLAEVASHSACLSSFGFV